ncbi:DUF1810 domain-containing protein [Sphingobium sp. AN558]|uniref:DUF1810 domain-containing protein n=1 Tax=Sphingobium sp. AN558 TaxID=3133442 RepID=UPI0030C5B6DB
MSADPHNLQRFVDAQQDTYATALAELRRGRKSSHWIWFIFSQIAGLGRSSTAQRYAITSVDEARAYLAHPTLGSRLRDCVQALQDLPQGNCAGDVLGETDAIKLRSVISRVGPVLCGIIFRLYRTDIRPVPTSSCGLRPRVRIGIVIAWLDVAFWSAPGHLVVLTCLRIKAVFVGKHINSTGSGLFFSRRAS